MDCLIGTFYPTYFLVLRFLELRTNLAPSRRCFELSLLKKYGFRKYGAQEKYFVASLLAELQLAQAHALTLKGEIFALR